MEPDDEEREKAEYSNVRQFIEALKSKNPNADINDINEKGRQEDGPSGSNKDPSSSTGPQRTSPIDVVGSTSLASLKSGASSANMSGGSSSNTARLSSVDLSIGRFCEGFGHVSNARIREGTELLPSVASLSHGAVHPNAQYPHLHFPGFPGSTASIPATRPSTLLGPPAWSPLPNIPLQLQQHPVTNAPMSECSPAYSPETYAQMIRIQQAQTGGAFTLPGVQAPAAPSPAPSAMPSNSDMAMRTIQKQTSIDEEDTGSGKRAGGNEQPAGERKDGTKDTVMPAATAGESGSHSISQSHSQSQRLSLEMTMDSTAKTGTKDGKRPLSDRDSGAKQEAKKRESRRFIPNKRKNPETEVELPKKSAPVAAFVGVGRALSADDDDSADGDSDEEEEDESRPDLKKRNRERRRRENMNVHFTELWGLVSRTGSSKADKESILADTIDWVKRQAKIVSDLDSKCSDLTKELVVIRVEKNELREDKKYLHAELDTARDEIRRLRYDNETLVRNAQQLEMMVRNAPGMSPMAHVAMNPGVSIPSPAMYGGPMYPAAAGPHYDQMQPRMGSGLPAAMTFPSPADLPPAGDQGNTGATPEASRPSGTGTRGPTTHSECA